MRKILSYLLLLCSVLVAQAQNKDLPVVGKPCPDFYLGDVNYYTKKKASLSDFKGKWLILDFWNRSCLLCLNSMPKMDKLQKSFQDRAQVIMVGYTGSQYYPLSKEPDDKKIRELYKKVRKKSALNLAVAYDSTLFAKFDVAACPYIVIVNPEGIVKGITSRISELQLDSLSKNMKVNLRRAYTSTESKERRRASAAGN